MYSKEDILREAKEHQIRFILLQFTDIMGVTTEVDAAIERIDLMENYIWIRKHE